MSSCSIKDISFVLFSISSQCSGDKSNCPFFDLRKYRTHLSVLVWFQRNLFEDDLCQKYIMMAQFLVLSSCHQ